MAYYKTTYFEYLLSILNGFEGSIESPRTHLDILLLNVFPDFPEDDRRTIARNAKMKATTKSISSSEVKNIAKTLTGIQATQRIPSLVLSLICSLFCVLVICFFIDLNLYPQHQKNQ